MRLKPILAIAALAVAIAGCSTTPPAGTLVPQAAPKATAPRVQLDVQGVGKGTISASRLAETSAIFEIARSELTYVVVYIVPEGTELPEGASIIRYLDDANGDGVYPKAEVAYAEPAEYTHVVYRFDDLRDAEIAWMQVRFKAEGYEADGSVAPGEYDVIATHRFGEGAAGRNAMPFLSFAPGAPATLHFAGTNGETDAFETYESLDVDGEVIYSDYKAYRLDLDLSLTTQDGKPLLGLNQDYLDLRRFDINPFSHWDPNLQLDLTEVGNGAYTLGIAFRHSAVPTAVDVALTLKTPPLIHDVEY